MLVAEAAVTLMPLGAINWASALYVRSASSRLVAAAEWNSSAGGQVAPVSYVVHERVVERSFLAAPPISSW